MTHFVEPMIMGTLQLHGLISRERALSLLPVGHFALKMVRYGAQLLCRDALASWP